MQQSSSFSTEDSHSLIVLKNLSLKLSTLFVVIVATATSFPIPSYCSSFKGMKLCLASSESSKLNKLYSQRILMFINIIN